MSQQHVDQLAVERGYVFVRPRWERHGYVDCHGASAFLEYSAWLQGKRKREPQGLSDAEKQLVRDALAR